MQLESLLAVEADAAAAVEGADVEVAEAARVPAEVFPPRAEPHVRVARAVGRVRAARPSCEQLGPSVGQPASSRPAVATGRKLAQLQRRVAPAPASGSARVQAPELDSARRPAAERRIALPEAVQRW